MGVFFLFSGLRFAPTWCHIADFHSDVGHYVAGGSMSHAVR